MSPKIKFGVFRTVPLKTCTLFRRLHRGTVFMCSFQDFLSKALAHIVSSYGGIQQLGRRVCVLRQGNESCNGPFKHWSQNRMEQWPHHCLYHQLCCFLTNCDSWGLSHLIDSCQCNRDSLQAGNSSSSFYPKTSLFAPCSTKTEIRLQLNSWQAGRPKHAQCTSCKGRFCKIFCSIASGVWCQNGAFLSGPP